MVRRRLQTEGSDASDHYKSINERPVDSISLEFFYRPHTITTMLATLAALTYTAFTRLHTCTSAPLLLHHHYHLFHQGRDCGLAQQRVHGPAGGGGRVPDRVHPHPP